ncbi:hypothetical protein DKX38_026883 [Salix brachista]|uniref:Transmembrane protein n=1 Tax=Salix brachista TaxID=2182728 RepID=A0A5N5JFW2_9ROSI|nr:hypothetical protein DKX38_026883 [Salix brachista]
MSADWGPVVVAVVLFIVLSPGLLFQLPARTRVVEFGNMYTSGISILVHAVIYFCIITILYEESASIDVKMSSQDENRIDSEKDESMNSYSHAIRLQTPKLHLFAVTCLTLGISELEGLDCYNVVQPKPKEAEAPRSQKKKEEGGDILRQDGAPFAQNLELVTCRKAVADYSKTTIVRSRFTFSHENGDCRSTKWNGPRGD